jgi:hypothetical protein
MTPKRAAMSALTAVLIVVVATVGAVQAGTKDTTKSKSCIVKPVKTGNHSGNRVKVVCKAPGRPAGYVTTTVTATATVTKTVTAMATATVTVSPSSGPTASPTQTPTQSTSPTPSSTPAPTLTASPTGTPGCASTSSNVPDGSDGRGGCFPGLSNTGPNAPASSMATYTGPCTITTANVVIDSKVVNCRTLVVASTGGGLMLKNSYLNGGIVQSGSAAAFTVQDSFIDSGVQYPACSDGSCPAGKYACGDPNNQTTDCGVTGSNFTILRTEIINSNRAAYCESSCLIQDSYFHGTNLWPDVSNRAHASSVREEQGLTLRHNSLHCSYTGPFVNGDIGCSADLTGYPDFAPIKNNTVDGNLFVANTGNGFCVYGGATSGKPFSGDPTNATYQKFTNNVFQRGGNSKCGAYGAVTSFNSSGAGNVWSNNLWDNATTVASVN